MTDEDQSNVGNVGATTPSIEATDDIAVALDDTEITTDQNTELPEPNLESGIVANPATNPSEDISSVAAAIPEIKEPPQLDSLDIAAARTVAPEPPKQDTVPEPSLTPLGGNVMSIKKIQNIKVNVQVMLGSVSLSISRLASLKKGELLSLDTSIGDPIEILANGQLIARGEIVVLGEDNPQFGISLVEIVDSDVAAI